jgi:hypothetical protein
MARRQTKKSCLSDLLPTTIWAETKDMILTVFPGILIMMLLLGMSGRYVAWRWNSGAVRDKWTILVPGALWGILPHPTR